MASLATPSKVLGDAIEPPLHHRGGSLVLSLMQVGILFSLFRGAKQPELSPKTG